jgi:hypothetical protein
MRKLAVLLLLLILSQLSTAAEPKTAKVDDLKFLF